jgi:hypothetical protein
MRFATILLLAPLLAAAAAEPVPNAENVAMAEDRVEVREAAPAPDLVSRDCKKTGCKCRKGTPQGQYCGNCKRNNNYVVIEKWYGDHVFECAPSGKCCDYGYAKDCGKKGQRCG